MTPLVLFFFPSPFLSFGNGPQYKVQFTVLLPSDKSEVSFTIETAPLELMPHAIHVFLEQVKYGLWNNGWFYINGPHVLQCGPRLADSTQRKEGYEERELALEPFKKVNLESLSFPEYTSKYPHSKWTIGYTKPGGPEWYINKVIKEITELLLNRRETPGDNC